MANRPNTLFLVALASATALSAPIRAQTGAAQDEPQVHHRNECRLAHQILTRGQPQNKRFWALGYASGCGALGGEALAAAVLRYQSGRVADGEMDKLVESAALLTDARIFNAALSVAARREAAVAIRVQAIRIAFHQLNPSRFESYETFVLDPLSTTTIYTPFVSSEAPPVGIPIPTDGLHRAAHAAGVILADSAASDELRRAASYLLGNVERQQARARLCSTSNTAQQCSRLMDEWDVQQERSGTQP